MERNKTIAVCSGSLAIASFIFIAALMATPTPLEADPAEIEHLEVGTLVRVEGRIDEGGVKDFGGVATLRLLGEAAGSVQVFLEFSPRDLRPGDRVVLKGTVSVYKGTPEVVVRSSADITLLARDPRPLVTLSELVADPWGFASVEPRVIVTVSTAPVTNADGNGSWCVVSSPTDGLHVVMCIPAGSDLGPWRSGERLEVVVRVGYDLERGVLCLESTEWWAA